MLVADIINGFAGLPPEQEVVAEIWDDTLEDVVTLYVNAIEYGPTIVLRCDSVKRSQKILEGWKWTPDGFTRVYRDPGDKENT